MTALTERHLELLALSHPLHRYAHDLEPDVNASLLLVHRALLKAFTEPTYAMRPRAGLEASLRADIDQGFLAADR